MLSVKKNFFSTSAFLKNNFFWVTKRFDEQYCQFIVIPGFFSSWKNNSENFFFVFKSLNFRKSESSLKVYSWVFKLSSVDL